MKRTEPEIADYIIARHRDLASQRAPWDSQWQQLAEYFLPRKANITSQQETGASAIAPTLFDSTGLHAAATLANGQLSYITPADSRWFVFDPPAQLRGNDKAAQWYQQCSEIAQMTLAVSNFYSEIHEAYYDDSVFGTYCLTVRAGKAFPLVFSKLDCGTYCVAENDEGEIDTLYRELEMTLDQATAEFGEDNLSEKMRRDLETYRQTGKGGTVKSTFIHAIFPRQPDERDVTKEDGPNKPWASIYIDVRNKHVCRNSGFDEKPFFAGRHVKNASGPYGTSPAWNALPDARQLNFLVKQLDALAEVKAFPRLLLSAQHEGEVDLRAGGVTYYDAGNPNAIPREWATAGEYAIGIDRENRKAESINKAFHVDMFRMFADINKQMTATEVSERAAEKIVQFSPSFARKTTELLTPMLRAVFGTLLRGGHFPTPPKEAAVPDVQGQPSIALPDVSYISRVALAIRAMQNRSFQITMEMSAPVAQIRPEVLDNYNFDAIIRAVARNNGMPAQWLADANQIEESRAARAKAQAEMQQQQQMLSAAEAAGKAGSVKQDSALAQAIGGMAK